MDLKAMETVQNTEVIQIKRALLSVSNKSSLVELAQVLAAKNCEMISTGGTRRVLEEAGMSTVEISEVSGNPEAFGGRMKTISFNVESALLFDREKDASEATALNIEAIDLVVCNLYPFKKVWEKGGSFEEQIENIDIGGPTMIRAAAKNFKYVAVLCDPNDYDWVQKEIEEMGGLTYASRKKLMVKAFELTADYDAFVSTVMSAAIGQKTLRMTFEEGIPLRYGENSHQAAHFYREKGADISIYDIEILNGKALSYNNILDINAAIEAINDAPAKHACSIIKHSNPCGFSEGAEQLATLELAWQGDPISAFGSIIAFNQTLSLETAEFFKIKDEDRSKRKFIEVIIAPDFDKDALTYLQQNKNLRVLRFDPRKLNETKKDYRYLNGSLLEQDADQIPSHELSSVTDLSTDLDREKALIEFGLRAIKNIKSNAIAIVRRKGSYFQLLGMGAGQPNRLIATQLANEKSKANLRNEFSGEEKDFEVYLKEEMGNAYLISDAFFPFADNVELAATFGVRKIVQPGGSIRDKDLIAACNRLGISMVFTGTRHFKH